MMRINERIFDRNYNDISGLIDDLKYCICFAYRIESDAEMIYRRLECRVCVEQFISIEGNRERTFINTKNITNKLTQAIDYLNGIKEKV